MHKSEHAYGFPRYLWRSQGQYLYLYAIGKCFMPHLTMVLPQLCIDRNIGKGENPASFGSVIIFDRYLSAGLQETHKRACSHHLDSVPTSPNNHRHFMSSPSTPDSLPALEAFDSETEGGDSPDESSPLYQSLMEVLRHPNCVSAAWIDTVADFKNNPRSLHSARRVVQRPSFQASMN